ncbi:MAG: hypothetical protein HQ591_12340 [candidate division Zixibacteria bacterium]|nr:hypothetical protein [Candidatus Tariuqbacter arcticus]
MQKNNKLSSAKESQFGERTLIYIPILHTQADMGALADSVRKATLKKLGFKGWKRKVNLIDRMWITIEKTLDNLNLPYQRVRLYQDGLPVCDREAEIVRELAGRGSRNHKILLRLMESGATIMGTESLELLMEEYELAKQSLAQGKTLKSIGMKARLLPAGGLSESLLKRRDLFIAERINNTLCSGETGILFLGMLHSLYDRLDKDIRILYPINQPLNC